MLKEIAFINIEYPNLFFVIIEKNIAVKIITQNILLTFIPVILSIVVANITTNIALTKNNELYLSVKYLFMFNNLMLI